MSACDDGGLDVAALLVGVCSGILADAIDDLSGDVDTGEYISEAAVDEVHQAIRFAMPTMSAQDRRLFGTGICTGLAAAMRFLEAEQHEEDAEPDYYG